MAKNVIEIYSKKAQEIIQANEAELQKLRDEITAQEGKIAEAEAEMESAMKVADQDSWKKANNKKRDASDSIEWSKRRLAILKKNPIIDEAELDRVQNEITAYQKSISDDAAKRVKDLIAQAQKILADAIAEINSGNSVKAKYAVNIAKTGDNAMQSKARPFDTGSFASVRNHFERADNNLA